MQPTQHNSLVLTKTHQAVKESITIPLSKAAIAVGIDGIFIETHPNPDKALSDGPNSLALDDMEHLLNKLVQIDDISKK